jgi:hypothetical protein
MNPGKDVNLYADPGAKTYYQYLGMHMIDDGGEGRGATYHWSADEAKKFSSIPKETMNRIVNLLSLVKLVHGGEGSGEKEGHDFRGNQYDGKQRTSGRKAIGFDKRPQDFAAYRDAPDLGQDIMSMEQVKVLRGDLKGKGLLNDDGRTVSLYHITDDDSAQNIEKIGFVPGYHAAPGQTWKSTHADYATYFFVGDIGKEVAIDQAKQAGGGFDVVEAKIPVTPKSMIRIIPDEDVSSDIHTGVKTLLEGGTIAYIGGVPSDSVKIIHREPIVDYGGGQ